MKNTDRNYRVEIVERDSGRVRKYWPDLTESMAEEHQSELIGQIDGAIFYARIVRVAMRYKPGIKDWSKQREIPLASR